MAKITKAAEDRLVTAIEKTATLVNAGAHPNDAIIKAATECSVPPSHVNLMVHAYNTGRTTRQRQIGQDVFEKSADFELADASTILERLYPTQVKTAAAVKRDTTVSTEYAIPPTDMLARRERQVVKEASPTIDWRTWSRGVSSVGNEPAPQADVRVTTPTPLASDPAYAMKKAHSEALRQQRQVDDARATAAATKERMATTFVALTDYFKTANAQPITVVKAQAALLHGDIAAKLLDEIVSITPGLMKLSQHKNATYDQYQMYPADGDGYVLIKRFLRELQEYDQQKQAYASVYYRNRDVVTTLLAPFTGQPASVLDHQVFTTTGEKQAAGIMAPLMSASLATTIMKNMTGNASKPVDEIDKAVASLTDSQHEQELRNISASSTLQDMMFNDPIVRTYPHTDVLRAYNDLVGLAPRAANQPMIMQSMLRKHVTQGVFDPFEIDQLLSLEDKQRMQNPKLQTSGGRDDE